MDEVVASVHKLTSIVGEITTASREQEMGIEQINEAITSMDTVTQQNAALVEEAAAATSALQDQAGKLAQAVSVFKLDEMASSGMAAPLRKVARPVAAVKPAGKAPARQLASTPKPALATKVSSHVRETEWEEF